MNIIDAENFVQNLKDTGLVKNDDFYLGLYDLPIKMQKMEQVTPWLAFKYEDSGCYPVRTDILKTN